MSSSRLLPLLALLLLLGFGLPLAANPFFGGDQAATPARTSVIPGRTSGLQAEFREKMAVAFEGFLEQPGGSALALLLGLAFVYGLLHAAGPGHRKTIIFSLFLGKQARVWEPLAAGFLSALVHAASGAVILLMLGLLRGALAGLVETERLVLWLDGLTLLVLTLLALFLVLRTLRRFIKHDKHTHGSRGSTVYSILALASIVPCPGTIMVLMFALYLNKPWLGIMAVGSMALGMGLVVSAAAYLAWFGRQGLFSRLKAHEHLMAKVSTGFELFSYSLILVFSFYTAWPFLRSLVGFVY